MDKNRTFNNPTFSNNLFEKWSHTSVCLHFILILPYSTVCIMYIRLVLEERYCTLKEIFCNFHNFREFSDSAFSIHCIYIYSTQCIHLSCASLSTYYHYITRKSLCHLYSPQDRVSHSDEYLAEDKLPKNQNTS